MALLDFLGCKITGTDYNVTLGISPGYKINELLQNELTLFFFVGVGLAERVRRWL